MIIFTSRFVLKVKKVFVTYVFLSLMLVACGGRKECVQSDDWTFAPPAGVALDTIAIDTMDLKNPFIRTGGSSFLVVVSVDSFITISLYKFCCENNHRCSLCCNSVDFNLELTLY